MDCRSELPHPRRGHRIYISAVIPRRKRGDIDHVSICFFAVPIFFLLATCCRTNISAIAGISAKIFCPNTPSSILLVGMSRTYRIKVDQEDTWYHCYNRTVGTSQDRPFDDTDKEQFVRILKRVCILYGVRVVAYQVMSNHYHLLVKAPKDMLSRQTVCSRYNAFHRGQKSMEPDSAACARWQIRTRDISWFMRHLQQLFTVWYNQSRSIRRRGKLWADRFKHTILEDGPAVWDCWKYIERNPYEAGMVKHPGDYRFSTYGVWRQTGHHPFATNVNELIVPMMGCSGLHDLWQMLNESLTPESEVATNTTPGTSVQGRVRYWVRGLVIGSEIYVRTVMAPHAPRAATRRIAKSPETLPDLCSWRRVQPAL